MGAIRALNPVKLFIGVLFSEARLIDQIEARLISSYGPVDSRSTAIPFDLCDREAEMCGPGYRVFFSFERLIEADRLPEIKRQTNLIEEEMAPRFPTQKRPVNLDPGYVEHAKVILASTKNFYHRIYIGAGIFGEVTMHFRNNACEFFPWTHPECQSVNYQEFFLKIREIYRSQLRTMCILKGSTGKDRPADRGPGTKRKNHG